MKLTDAQLMGIMDLWINSNLSGQFLQDVTDLIEYEVINLRKFPSWTAFRESMYA